jgi:hypothetical protein
MTTERAAGCIGAVGRIILKWILKECSLRMWTGFIWLRMEFVTNCCENIPQNELENCSIF